MKQDTFYKVLYVCGMSRLNDKTDLTLSYIVGAIALAVIVFGLLFGFSPDGYKDSVTVVMKPKLNSFGAANGKLTMCVHSQEGWKKYEKGHTSAEQCILEFPEYKVVSFNVVGNGAFISFVYRFEER